MSGSSGKRNRYRKVCLACRRRKSKCNCRRPVCDTCVIRQTEHICIYDDLFPFQRSLRQYQPQAVNPNFPQFDMVHLPQMIAAGQSMSFPREYTENLLQFDNLIQNSSRASPQQHESQSQRQPSPTNGAELPQKDSSNQEPEPIARSKSQSPSRESSKTETKAKERRNRSKP
ncbi:hypothetical protein PUMCH_000401 [Australozyma saopauloensis]|uniref:Zn(2)-C6 fungal-type domain-containing protein n=1 Tax=Australozyma saopauloensis TaxID=291208 RepID=A0AAX4H3V1_9ASCO|nr:hypothetical protein PUMCH_000401 [[Candida] saopauloensis]